MLSAAARRLQVLSVACSQIYYSEHGTEALLRIIGWAPSHPSLAQLAWEVGDSLPSEVCAAALQAQRRRPALIIQPCDALTLYHLFEEKESA